MVVACQARRHRIVFTHSDLVSRNILVDSNGQLQAILDWERAGWFPEYWEYTTSLQQDIFRAWIKLVHEMFSEYELEREAEAILSSNVTHI
jgi:thiamine kinase-like enzyme